MEGMPWHRVPENPCARGGAIADPNFFTPQDLYLYYGGNSAGDLSLPWIIFGLPSIATN